MIVINVKSETTPKPLLHTHAAQLGQNLTRWLLNTKTHQCRRASKPRMYKLYAKQAYHKSMNQKPSKKQTLVDTDGSMESYA